MLLLIAGVAALVILNGCGTTQTAAQRVQTAVKLAAYDGTFEYLAQRPEARPGFIAARDELHRLELADTVDVVTLMAIVRRLPVKELKSQTSKLIIGNATILLSDYVGEIPVERLGELRPIISAIRQGIDEGLR